MNIVIPYRTDLYKGTELLFALRSIEKNLSGYGKVYIVGDCPEWLTGVEWIKTTDVPGRKQLSLLNKVMWACNNLEEGKFGYWHDDHFLLKPLHVSEIKNWYDGTLNDIQIRSGGRYYMAVYHTINLIGNQKYYDIHVPCVFDRDKFKTLTEYNWGTKDYIIKSLYFNKFAEEPEQVADCKIDNLMSTEAITERIKDRLFFSTGSNGIKQPMIKKLNELYPNKSIYERH